MELFFTPSQPLFHSEWDGAWQVAESTTEPLSFSPDMEQLQKLPLTTHTSGNAGRKGESGYNFSETFFLNKEGNPEYLVNNTLQASFTISPGQEAWLFFSLKGWSREELTSFDDPGWVVFLGDSVLWQEPPENDFFWHEYYFPLGTLNNGSYTVSFFSGEMGDVQYPSGLELQNILVLTRKTFFASPTPLPSIFSASPTPVVTVPTKAISAARSFTQFITPTPFFSPTSPSPFPRNWDTVQGSVLGATAEQPETRMQEFLQSRYFPVFLVFLMVIFVFVFSFLLKKVMSKKKERKTV